MELLIHLRIQSEHNLFNTWYNCPNDEAYVVVDVFSASSISITSQNNICSNDSIFTLSGIPPVGWSPQGQGIFTDNNGTIIMALDPAFYGTGVHNITYTSTPTGCAPIPIGGSITVNEAPTVLASNVIVTTIMFWIYRWICSNHCFGIQYTVDWFGSDPLQLSSGYIITK